MSQVAEKQSHLKYEGILGTEDTTATKDVNETSQDGTMCHETQANQNEGFVNSRNSSRQRSLEYPRIPNVFEGKSVLVTGATGFLGKVLVEKLLRSCPGIEEIFILLRPTKKSGDDRLNDFLQNNVFDRIRQEVPDALKKIRGLPGDVELDNIGLSDFHLRKVVNDISFVFHCAANVRFDDKPRNTLRANLCGVENIFEVCKKCVKLEALVHVSTAYSFCNNPVISEQIYPESISPQHVLEITKWMNNEQLRAVCWRYVQDRPSLYHFSKAMAETFLIESNRGLPVIIVRPSIVTASVEEPFPGWIDNYNGPSGFIHVCGKGIVRTLLVDPKVNADWVPVDTVANTLIAAAHYLVIRRTFEKPHAELTTTGDVPIINCTCPNTNVITWMKVVNICLPLLREYPSIEVYDMPGGTVTPSPFIYLMCRLSYHYLPALLIDLILCLTLKKRRLISLYIKIHKVMSHLEYYTTRPFTFKSQNMQKLVRSMDPNDRKVFPIDQNVLDWNRYIKNYVLGVRRYFSKEADDTLPLARKRMMRFHYVWLTMKITSCAGMLMFFKYLHQRGVLKTTIFTSLSLFSIAARFQGIAKRS